jgi:DNA-binding NarL/FixJ family response regulator
VTGDIVTVVIVDDHQIVREGIRHMLSGESDFRVVGEAADGHEGVEMIRELSPDVALMDLQMPLLDGVGALKKLSEGTSTTAVLVVTTYDTDADIFNAIDAGAAGYLLKDTPAKQLFEAVRAAARGEPALGPKVASRLMGELRRGDPVLLTPREIDVLGLAGEGFSNREIAQHLHIGQATVKSHLVHIYRKLDVDDRTHAVTVALQRGLIRLGTGES